MPDENKRDRGGDSSRIRDGIVLIPYAEVNGTRCLSDDCLSAYWEAMKKDGVNRAVFGHGQVSSAPDFIKMLKHVDNLPVFVAVDGQLLGLAWLNDIYDNHAVCHVAFLKPAWGKYSVEMGRKILDYWFSIPDQVGEPLFDTIIGNIPDWNVLCIKWIKKLGFTCLGVIPNIENGNGMSINYIERGYHG